MASDSDPIYRAEFNRQQKHLRKFAKPKNAKRDANAGRDENVGTDASDPPWLAPIVQHLLPVYAQSDTAANWYQKVYVRASCAIYFLAAVAVSIAIIQFLFLPDLYALIWLEVLTMLGALVLLWVMRLKNWQKRWLHARHLAEQVRTAMFLIPIPGVHQGRHLQPIQDLPFYRKRPSADKELEERVKKALEHESLGKLVITDFNEARRYLILGWIIDQAKYHRANARKKRRKEKWAHRIAVALFIVTLIAAVMHALGVGHVPHDSDPTHPSQVGSAVLVLLTVLCTIVLPAWAGAVHGLGALFDWERIAERSERMRELLTDRARHARQQPDMIELRACADEVEQMMAIENYEWLVSIMTRPGPPSVPG